MPFEDQVWKKWSPWMARWPHAVRGEVMVLVHGWTGGGKTAADKE